MELPFADCEIADAETGIALVRPCGSLIGGYRDACAETWNHIHDRYILHDPEKFSEWEGTVLQMYDDRQRGKNLPEGYYPSVTLWAVVPDEQGTGAYVGSVNVRTIQDASLISYGGTFGFFIRCSMRGRGYGHAIARLGLQAAQRLGCSPIVATCQESNPASMAVNSQLPWLRRERDVVEIYGTRQPIWRFWFSESACASAALGDMAK